MYYIYIALCSYSSYLYIRIKLCLDASPELLYWFSEQTLQPGPTVSLKCVATGNPLPQFTWSLDGFPVSIKIDNMTLKSVSNCCS